MNLEPFTTDGCSGGMSILWRRLFNKPPPWEGFCIEHDKAYWRGGTWLERLDADMLLFENVWKLGYRVWACLIFIGVRIGGAPIFPFGWRWGYGWENV